MPGVLSRIVLRPTQIKLSLKGTLTFQQCRFFKRKADTKGFSPKQADGIGSSQPKNEIVKANLKKDSFDNIAVEYAEPLHVPYSNLLRPFLFAVGFTGVTFTGAAIWQYEGLRKAASKPLSSMYDDIFRTPKFGNFREKINDWYNKLPEGQCVALGIITANVLVFSAWKVPALQYTMLNWFACNPASRVRCIPMVLATFSHFTVWHILVNMYVLWSFSSSVSEMFGPEQFLAMYLTAGVWSSFFSYVNKLVIGRFHPSLGASGAIFALLGAVCTSYPDSRLQIIFLPFFTFPASLGMKAIIGLETTGILLRWRIFDHAGHLAGILFGWYYVKYGHKQIWGKREPLMKYWHKLRQSYKGR
ncbi:presenilin-associated rhomboid-like protein, mitochondrial [Saccoglossus kowalevskii]|uniref:rhomboid protease n=1 Tax=Saccoglossus kowalevskii TaxID=10224 RepID=A0ABM0GYI2_SACKO|nr:PREDICTED: presenilins-associated rhomboid-like protein, mitochondrial-like [Saccoglossus kowalevskii]